MEIKINKMNINSRFEKVTTLKYIKEENETIQDVFNYFKAQDNNILSYEFNDFFNILTLIYPKEIKL